MGDDAAIQVRAWDVGTHRTPLLGMPSTLSAAGNTHHPGPLQFWLLAPLARAVRWLSGSMASLAVAQALLNLLVLAAALWAVWRCTRRLGAVWVAALAAVAAMWVAGSSVGFEPYNPAFAFVALVAAVVAAAAVLIRADTYAVGVLAITASAAAQAHLTYALPAAAVAVVGAVAYFRSGERTPGGVTWLAILIVAVWSGPLLDAVVHGGGNLSRYVSAAGTSTERTGLLRAVTRLVRSLSPFDLGLHRHAYRPFELIVPASPFDWVWALLLFAVISAAAVRDRQLRRFTVGALALTVACVVGAAITPYGFAAIFAVYLQWVWVVPVFCWWALAAVAVWRASKLVWPPRWKRPTIAVVTVAALGLAFGPVVFGSASEFVTNANCARSVRLLADSTPHGSFVLDATRVNIDSLKFESKVSTGLYAELVARGDDGVLVGAPAADYYDVSRTRLSAEPVTHHLFLVADDTKRSEFGLPLASVTGDGCDAGQGVDGAATVVLWQADS